MSEDGYWERQRRVLDRRITRRRLLGTGAGTGAAALLAACSSNNKNNAAKSGVPPASAASGGAPGGAATAAPSGSSAPRPSPAAAAAKKGGTLQTATVGEATGFDPHAVTGFTLWVAYAGLFDALLRYAPKDLSLTPGLATKWETPDPTTLTFTLRDGVQFHDGTPFNADAAKYNVDRVLDPATKALDRTIMSVISKSEVTAPNQLKLTLKQPAASLLAMFGYRPGMMVSRDAAEKGMLMDKPVGTGAFKFVDWTKGSQVRFDRFPNYWEKDASGNQLPYLDSFQVKVLPDGEQQFNALSTNTVQVVELGSIAGIGPGYIDRVKSDSNLVYSGGDTLGFRGIVVNLAIAPMDNPDLRRALSYAIDKKAFIDAVQFGKATVATEPASPRDWAYDPSIQGYPYDPAKAKESLAKSGQPNGFTFQGTVDSTPDLASGAELLKAQYAKVGINWDYRVVDRVTNTTLAYDQGNSVATVGGSGGRVDFGQEVSDYFVKGGRYMVSSKHPEAQPDADIERLAQQGDQVYDVEQRKKIYSDLQKRVVDLVYGHVLISYPQLGFGTRKNVQGFTWYGDNYPRFQPVWLA